MHLYLNIINPIISLLLIISPITTSKNNNMLSSENYRPKISSIFMPLIKDWSLDSAKSLPCVYRIGLDGIVVDSDAPVRVSDGEVDCKIVVEIVVVVLGEVESGEGCVRGVKFDFVGSDYEPED